MNRNMITIDACRDATGLVSITGEKLPQGYRVKEIVSSASECSVDMKQPYQRDQQYRVTVRIELDEYPQITNSLAPQKGFSILTNSLFY